MRLRLNLCLFFGLIGSCLWAQNQMPETRPNNFADYLVQLAWKFSPELTGQSYDIDVRQADIALAKSEWTRQMQGGLNVNAVSLGGFLRYDLNQERFLGRTIDTTRLTRTITYPLWNVGLNVSLGDVLSRKHKIRAAESRRKISETELLTKKQRLKTEVLLRYEGYLQAKEILKVRLQALDIAQANRTQLSSLFQQNKIAFEDYNQSNQAYFTALEGRVKAESDLKKAQLGLEDLIGVKWEQIDKVRLNYEKKE